MATLSFEEFPLLHTLTAPESRKVQQIKLHPDVNWMFRLSAVAEGAA